MNKFTPHKFLILILILQCQSTAADEYREDRKIQQIYHKLNTNTKSGIIERIEYISRLFINKPYKSGALGEGSRGYFDQSPLYRTDSFDCETFVDTVLALAIASNLQSFKECINSIRYESDTPSFTKRNHFTTLDWNPNNEKKGFIQDITESITNKNHQTIYLMAETTIDKPSWYRHLDKSAIKLMKPTQALIHQRWYELRLQAAKFKIQNARIPYIPLNVLFDDKGKPDLQIFSQIPQGSIIEIVRPSWDLRKEIGTKLNVSHLGFVFWKNGEPVFRQASSLEKKIIDVPLIEYLLKMRQSPTIKGVNIHKIIPKEVSDYICNGKADCEMATDA